MVKFITIKEYEPFDVPTDESIQKRFSVPEGCSVLTDVRVNTEGDYVVDFRFGDIIKTLEARGARRRESYIVSLNQTMHGLVLGIGTFRSYLSQEDLDS